MSLFCIVSETLFPRYCTVYVNAYDLEKSFSFDKTVEIASHVLSDSCVNMLYLIRYGC